MRKISLIIILLMLAEVSSVQAGVWWVDGYLVINDGDIYDGELFITDYGSVDILGGMVGKLETWDYSTGNIYGGEMDWLWTDDYSVVNIYGGNFNWLASRPDSKVHLYAYDVNYHETGGLYDNPWLEGKYLIDGSSFAFTLYDDDSLSQVSIVSKLVGAQVDIKPNSLNLQSKGKWLTCHIHLPKEYDVADIEPNSIRLEEVFAPEWMWLVENEQVVMVKFKRAEARAILERGQVELTVSGNLVDGSRFQGTDTIRVTGKSDEGD